MVYAEYTSDWVFYTDVFTLNVVFSLSNWIGDCTSDGEITRIWVTGD